MVEQQSPQPRAVSSSLTTPAKTKRITDKVVLFVLHNWEDLNERGGFCVKQNMPVACFVAKTRVRRVPKA